MLCINKWKCKSAAMMLQWSRNLQKIWIYYLAGCSPVPGYPPSLAWSGRSGLGHPPGSMCSLNAVSSIGISWPHAWQRTLFPLWISKIRSLKPIHKTDHILLDNEELLVQLMMLVGEMLPPANEVAFQGCLANSTFPGEKELCWYVFINKYQVKKWDIKGYHSYIGSPSSAGGGRCCWLRPTWASHFSTPRLQWLEQQI